MSELRTAMRHEDGQRLRQRLERAIERLIMLLDAVDGDADLEDGEGQHLAPTFYAKGDCEDDEPSLGWSGIGTGMRPGEEAGLLYGEVDLEDQCDDEGADDVDGGTPPAPRYVRRLRSRRIETAARRAVA